MKNTTKKILSMLLAVIMLLSVMPVAYAEEKSVRDIFIEEYAKLGAYVEYNTYVQEYGPTTNFDEATVLDMLKAGRENNEEKLLAYTEMLKERNSQIDKDISDGKLTVVIDGYYVALLESKVFFYGDINFDIIEERNAELFKEANAAYQNANNIRHNGGTQNEYDAAVKKWVDVYSLTLEHLCGNHDFNEYISNNDATEEADGTKTATCEFCGATDTVVDEGSKLNNNDNSKCSCNCHKSGIMGLIWKIINFFYKIFGMNKTCVCGVAHY